MQNNHQTNRCQLTSFAMMREKQTQVSSDSRNPICLQLQEKILLGSTRFDDLAQIELPSQSSSFIHKFSFNKLSYKIQARCNLPYWPAPDQLTSYGQPLSPKLCLLFSCCACRWPGNSHESSSCCQTLPLLLRGKKAID